MRSAAMATTRPPGLPNHPMTSHVLWSAISEALRPGRGAHRHGQGAGRWLRLTILTWSNRLGRLVNKSAADHTHGLPGGTPILALDMYKHAYHLDFGAKAAAYVDQIMANLSWERIGARYRLAIGEEVGDELFLPYGAPPQDEARISAEELKAALDDTEERVPVLLDLCQPRDLPRRTDMLTGATMHAPAALAQWFEELPQDRPIVVYCICGFQVSGTAVTELRRRGFDARALAGVSPPGMRSGERRCRSIPLPTSKRPKHSSWPKGQGIQQPPLQMVVNHPRCITSCEGAIPWML